MPTFKKRLVDIISFSNRPTITFRPLLKSLFDFDYSQPGMANSTPPVVCDEVKSFALSSSSMFVQMIKIILGFSNSSQLSSSLKCKVQRSCSSVTPTYSEMQLCHSSCWYHIFCIFFYCPPGNCPSSQISGKGRRQSTTSNWQGASICSRKRGNLLIVTFFMDLCILYFLWKGGGVNL